MLSANERRRFIEERIHKDWGWRNWDKGHNGHSYRQIMNEFVRAYGADQVPNNPMTYRRDIQTLIAQNEKITDEDFNEAERLLDPNLFPEWRARFFRTPTGEPYQTPKFQHAIFWVMHAATFKVALPDWVISYLDDLDPKHPFPEDINELLTGEQENFLSFLLLMAPRHGKTELTVHYMLHTFAMDANKRIMFGNGTQRKSEGFIDNAVMTMMEPLDQLSKEFVDMYGPFRSPDRPWSRTGLTLAGREFMNKMYSIQPYGLSGNIRSFDSDAIIGDDLADLSRSRSDTITEQDYNWLTTELMTRREYQTALLLLGSHVAVQSGDIFARLLNNIDKLNVGRSRFIVKTIPAHFYEKCDPINDPEHVNCVLWHDLRDYGFLEAKRAELDDDAMFEAVFNQIPMTPQMMHFPADIMRRSFVLPDMVDGVTPPPAKDSEAGVLDSGRSWRQLPIMCCGKETAVGVGFDPAFSERSGAAFSALAVKAACTKCGRRYWVDWGKERMSPEAHVEYIGSFTGAYPQIEVVTLESNIGQKYLAVDPRMEALAQKDRFYIKQWTTDERKSDPEVGIPAYGRHYKSGMVSIPYRTLADHEQAEPLIKEFIRWPQRPNDLVMAGWLCDMGLEEIVESARYTEAVQMPGTENWQSEWHDENTFEVDMSLVFDGEWE